MAAPTERMERTSVPGIYKRGNRYVVVWRHRGRQCKEFFPTFAEAREAKGRRDAGERRKTPRIRFGEYAPKWIELYRGRTSRGFEETTRAEYRRDVDQWLVPYFGSEWLDDVDAGDVKEWFVWMESRGASATSIRKAKATLSALFATAVEERKVRHNPVLGVRFVSRNGQVEKRRRNLTLTELNRLLEAVPAEWRLLFELLAYGLRIGELIGLTRASVHLGDDPRLTISEQVYRGKRKKLKTPNAERVLPLSAGMARRLFEHMEASPRKDPTAPLFQSKVGTPLDYSALYNRVLVPARNSAGLEWVSFHSIRHFTGSLLHEQGRTLRQMSDWLGHYDPAFTMKTYVGLMDEGLGGADFMDTLVGAGQQEGNKRATQHPQTATTPESGQAPEKAL